MFKFFSHDIIWTFETQVMPKKKVGNQIDNLTPDH